MLERIIFNILSFSLFILIFSKLIRKNDTAYVVPISLEALGIAIGLIEILLGKYLGTFIRVITYILAVVLPLAIIILEKYGFNVSEIIYLVSARMFNLLKNSKKSKTLLLNLINKYPESYNGHKLLAQTYEKEGGMRKAIDEYVKAIDSITIDDISTAAKHVFTNKPTISILASPDTVANQQEYINSLGEVVAAA